MTVASQIVTLLAVAVGAGTSFVFTIVGDRLRFRRDQSRYWADRKLDAYTNYLTAVKRMNQVSRRIAASGGIGRAVPELKSDEGLAVLGEVEMQRANASEIVALLGDSATIIAVRDLNREVLRLASIARGVLTADQDIWEKCNQAYVNALNVLHDQIRRDLQIPGSYPHRELERTQLTTSTKTPSSSAPEHSSDTPGIATR